MAPLEIRHRSVRPISAKHAQASRFLQQSPLLDRRWRHRIRARFLGPGAQPFRSEEHTSELQSLMRISYAVFCLKKKNYNTNDDHIIPEHDAQLTSQTAH